MAFTSTLELRYEVKDVDLQTAKGKFMKEEYSWDGTSVTTGVITTGSGTIKSIVFSGDTTGDYFRTFSGNAITLNFPSGAAGSLIVTLLRK